MIIGAIEAGGTKFVCGLFDADFRESAQPTLIAKASIPTTKPGPTLEASLAFFADFAAKSGIARLDSIGIGSFGPVDLRLSSPTWGYITSTPKPGWSSTWQISAFSPTAPSRQPCTRAIRPRTWCGR